MSERPQAVFERLLKQRIVLVGATIDDDRANVVIAQMLYLDAESKARDITLYLNSPGGGVTSALAIHDAMRSLAAPVATCAIGEAAGMAALLLAAGRPGKRFAVPTARVALLAARPPASGGDPTIVAAEIRRMDAIVCDLLARYTRRDAAKIAEDMERGTYLSAAEARDYGLVGAIAARGLR